MRFRTFIRILETHGFELVRRGKGSHRVYKGFARGKTRMVVVSVHSESDDVLPGTLASMIRQSGLNRKLFR